MDQPQLLEQTSETPTTQPTTNETPPQTITPLEPAQSVSTEAPKPPASLLNDEAPKTPDPGKDGEAPRTAPEKYEDFKVEGINLDPKAIEAATPLFKELGLNQEQAQKVVEAQARREAEIIKSANDAYTSTIDGWKKAVTDKYGTSINDVRTSVGRLLDTLPDDTRAAFREAMDVTGAGNHPGFVDAIYHLSKAAAEGKFVQPSAPAPSPSARPASQAQAIYGDGPATTPQRG